jgi:hypothetical protein
MSATIDDFWARKQALEEHTKLVTERLRIVQEAGRLFFAAVKRGSGAPWQWVDVTSGGPFPSHVMDSGRTFDASQFPSGKEIEELLGRWHALDHEYRTAWVRLSAQEKEQLRAHEPQEQLRPEPPA